MGFFSFKTADTEESIPVEVSGMTMKPVFLLQPNGNEPIREDCYKGNGVFGGVECRDWLAKANDLVSSSLSLNSTEESYFEDCDNYFACYMEISEDELRAVVPNKQKPIIMFTNYKAILKDGMCVNDLIDQGTIKPQTIQLTYPLKFSFDENAVYEDLPASKECEFQGYADLELNDAPGMGF